MLIKCTKSLLFCNSINTENKIKRLTQKWRFLFKPTRNAMAVMTTSKVIDKLKFPQRMDKQLLKDSAPNSKSSFRTKKTYVGEGGFIQPLPLPLMYNGGFKPFQFDNYLFSPHGSRWFSYDNKQMSNSCSSQFYQTLQKWLCLGTRIITQIEKMDDFSFKFVELCHLMLK